MAAQKTKGVGIADEINGYTATVLAGARFTSRFNDLMGRVKGGATIDQSYAATYMLGLIEMAELCAAVAKGKPMADVVRNIERRITELEDGTYAAINDKAKDTSEG